MRTSSITQALKKAGHQLLWNYSRWILLAGLIWYVFTGVYKIERNSIGVQTRFGKVVDPSVPPGLHYKLPNPIDRVITIPVKQVKTLVINDFGSRFKLKEGGKSYDFYKQTDLDPYCITGDNNIVAIALVLKYTIDNPVKYLFGTIDPEYLVERTAANLIIHHLAYLKIDDILTTGKKQIEFELQKSLGESLEPFDTGIRISFLEIKEIQPPKRVQEAFDRVINAEVDKKKMLNEAQGYYNRMVPEARTEANRLIQEARAYKREKILGAEGEISRFLSQFEGFQQNPEAQKDKMYLDFITAVYPKLGEIRVIKTHSPQQQRTVPAAFLTNEKNYLHLPEE